MVKIISDSTSDLSQDLLDRYNISLVPLIVRLGDCLLYTSDAADEL